MDNLNVAQISKLVVIFEEAIAIFGKEFRAITISSKRFSTRSQYL
ncbi:hypothetical protein [Phormidium tenue]|nr:hypothetical protein [Phormidium tenue]